MSVLDKPHWRYWRCVLKEVQNKKDVRYRFQFTDVKEQKSSFLTVSEERAQFKAQRNKRIYMETAKGDVYFSRREAECAYQLSQGKTFKEVARILSLSTRTVEYYLKNMKLKLKCRTRSELIGKIINSPFRDRYTKEFG